MVGGGKRDESLVLNSSNVFAALGSLKKKKSKASLDKQGPSKAKGSRKGSENEVFWAPAPLTVKSWADVDDEDDDDYYATTAPPAAAWGSSAEDKALESEPADEKSESDEGLAEVDDDDDDVEEDHENEPEEPAEVPVVKPPLPSLPPKDSERQLSKKELKKRELEELEAMLAEMGIANKESSGKGDSQEKIGGNVNGEAEKKDGLGESKSAKKKKRKDKTSKETKESQEDAVNGTRETAASDNGEDISAIDLKERIKKVGPGKKKKSSKEMDGAARAAANEAAARNARLAAAKKKEKNHYNQQPVR